MAMLSTGISVGAFLWMVISQRALWSPSLVTTVILVWPSARAVILPFPSTAAILLSSAYYAMVLSVALSGATLAVNTVLSPTVMISWL